MYVIGFPLQNMLTGIMSGTSNVNDAWKGMLKNMEQELANFIASAAVSRLMELLLGMGGGGWLQGLFKGIEGKKAFDLRRSI